MDRQWHGPRIRKLSDLMSSVLGQLREDRRSERLRPARLGRLSPRRDMTVMFFDNGAQRSDPCRIWRS